MLGQFFGSPPKIEVIQFLVNKPWGQNGHIDFIPLDDEGFLFKFGDAATLTRALEGVHGF